MKKSFILVFLMGLVLALNSCIACHTSKETSQQDSVTTTVVESMDVEHIIATDK